MVWLVDARPSNPTPAWDGDNQGDNMKGTEIIVSAYPRGVREECVISGTPKPGTCLEIVPATLPINGRFTYRLVTRANGSKGPVVIAEKDRLQGKTELDAYVSGTQGFIY